MKLPWTLLLRVLGGLLDVLREFLSERKRLKLESASRANLPGWPPKPQKSRRLSSAGESSSVGEFDKIFEEEGRGLPVPFLRALARRESGNNPSDAKGPAWGLLQVGIDARAGNVLKSYNERTGTAYIPRDMLDPTLNVRVAADLLSRIVELYKVEGLEADWTNGNWVGLVVAGWNAGYSRKAGVIKVIRHLKTAGIPVTLEAVYMQTPKAGAGKGFVKRMGQQKRRKWTRSVVASTFKEQGRPPTLKSKEKTEWLPLMLALLLLR